MRKYKVIMTELLRPNPSPPKTYTGDEALAGMCVWEWLIELRRGKREKYNNEVIVGLFTDHGYAAMRSVALQAALIVEDCWRYQATLHEEPFDSWSFDWDFVPGICRLLDWPALADDNQYHGGEWRPDVRPIVATLIAQVALGAGRKVALS